MRAGRVVSDCCRSGVEGGVGDGRVVLTSRLACPFTGTHRKSGTLVSNERSRRFSPRVCRHIPECQSYWSMKRRNPPTFAGGSYQCTHVLDHLRGAVCLNLSSKQRTRRNALRAQGTGQAKRFASTFSLFGDPAVSIWLRGLSGRLNRARSQL
jgi:hypothetical protein